MADLTPPQIAILSRLNDLGFTLIAFPMYATCVGVKRENCAALLSPDDSGFKIVGEPSWLIDNNLTVKITNAAGQQFYVWKKTKQEATPASQSSLSDFTQALTNALNATK
jgi:hypothetical protein